MKIGIESQRIFRKAKHGMDVVALSLIRQVQLIDKKNQYILFAKNDEDRRCISDTQNFKTHIVNGFTYADWEQISLPAAVKKFKPDLLHCTANTAPFKCSVPMIVTIHDIIYLEETNYGGSVYQYFGNLYRKFVVPHAIKKAKKIITVSEYEKTLIAGVCKTDPAKIEVVLNGVDNSFHAGISTEKLETFRKQYNLPEKFILFLGNTAPKKNTAGVVRAYVNYCSMVNDPFPIVITDYHLSSIRSILERVKRPELINRFIMPGYIPSSQMPLLYNCSTVFLYPSLRESFGLPVLEAMACGIPVITSDIPPIREVAGGAARFINPEDPLMLGEALHQLLKEESLMNSYKQKGLDRASHFSWEDSTRKLINIYESL